MTVLLSRHQYTESMLVVNDIQHTVGDNHAVARAETSLHAHIAGVIQSLLHEDERIVAGCLGLCYALQDEIPVAVGAFIHLLVVEGEVLDGISNLPAQSLFHLVGAKFVAVGSGLGVFAGLVGVFLREPCRRRAGNPAMTRRGREQGMLTHGSSLLRWHRLLQEALHSGTGQLPTGDRLRIS